MMPHLFFYQLILFALIWLFVMLPHLWPSSPRGMTQKPADPLTPKRKRATEPKPFAGLTQRPHCAACEHANSLDVGRTQLDTGVDPRRLSVRARMLR